MTFKKKVHSGKAHRLGFSQDQGDSQIWLSCDFYMGKIAKFTKVSANDRGKSPLIVAVQLCGGGARSGKKADN